MRVWWALFLQKKAVLVQPVLALLVKIDRGDSDFVAAELTNAKILQISPDAVAAAETAAHTRRKKSARDEGRATQRSNG